MEEFGPRVRRLRLALGMTPNELAHSVGVTEGAIRQMESGQTRIASFPVGVRLAEALGVEPSYLAFGDVKKEPTTFADRFAALEERVSRLELRRGLAAKSQNVSKKRR